MRTPPTVSGESTTNEVAIDASARQLLSAERRMQPTAEATDDAPAPDRAERQLIHYGT
jgi:hypothetical protein